MFQTQWERFKTWFFFRFADFRLIKSFPYLAYYFNSPKISMKEAREASATARPGDIALHRHDHLFSNHAIPGAFKHVSIMVENNDCIEALAHGIIQRDNLYSLLSDYALILRPIFTTKPEVNKALERAKSQLGNCYSDRAFAPGELAAMSWYHNREKLNIRRSQHQDREVFRADDFMRMNFGIIWKSSTVTPEWAEEEGMSKEGVQKIKDYIDGIRDFNSYGNPVLRKR